jgi:HPt (histidine-containing phosphotransfer) domain-containing protein
LNDRPKTLREIAARTNNLIRFGHEFADWLHTVRTLRTRPQLAAAIASGDAEAARKFAHTLKGSSANMGGEKFSEIASRMESAGKQRDLGGLSRLLPDAEVAFQALIAALKSEFDLRG